ncbi:heavy metal translocating P-type ATPase [Patescibacteria group bacterium]|nr:heavy metal translocating P-type ATPase [Patescibacteria group bacterium]
MTFNEGSSKLGSFLDKIENYVPILVLTGLVISGFFWYVDQAEVSNRLLLWITFVGAVPFFLQMLLSFTRGHFGVDLIAAVGIFSSLLIGEQLAGAVILLMLSGGEFLENFALRRAKKELTLLIANAPKIAHLKQKEGLVDVSVDDVEVGQIIVVKPGEVIPVDGVITKGSSSIDESSLTGESLPIQKGVHASVLSGSINKDHVLELRATHRSKESKYQQIIQLVKDAEKHKARFVRLADRYSVFFTVVAFALAGAAWILSGTPIRALSVLVVATPCPLILATPIAFACGISQAAKRGIIIKNGSVIEKLAQAKSFLFDKTGTLTLGEPQVHNVESYSQRFSTKEVLSLAASLDQLSAHVLARSLKGHADQEKINLSYPEEFHEEVGKGVTGSIDGQSLLLGKLAYLKEHHVEISDHYYKQHKTARAAGQVVIYLATKKKIIGAIFFQDIVRPNIKKVFATLRQYAIRVIMVTGDKAEVAQKIAHTASISEVYADLLPEEKVQIVEKVQKTDQPVVMVGDGINDAPALARADVGITLGGHGSTAASEAGDVTIMVDNLERIQEVYQLSRRVLEIALQCVLIGMGLSIGLMFIAAAGFIKPVIGALLQEVIDVVVILNALRVYIKPTHYEQ